MTMTLDNGRTPRPRLARLATVLALACLAVGSAFLSVGWMASGATGEEETMTRAFHMLALWPSTMLALWLFGTAALVLAGRWRLAGPLLVASLVALVGIPTVLSFVVRAPAPVGVSILLALNLGVIYLACRVILRQVGAVAEGE